MIPWDYSANPGGWEAGRTRKQVPVYRLGLQPLFPRTSHTSSWPGMLGMEPLNFSMQSKSPGVLAGGGKDLPGCAGWRTESGGLSELYTDFQIVFRISFPYLHPCLPRVRCPQFLRLFWGAQCSFYIGILSASICYSAFLVLLSLLSTRPSPQNVFTVYDYSAVSLPPFALSSEFLSHSFFLCSILVGL